MEISLPSRPFIGNVTRVLNAVSVEANLNLGFGIKVDRQIDLESISFGDIPLDCREKAHRCLIVLLGGKTVWAKVDDRRRDGKLLGRVYIPARVSNPPIDLTRVCGYDLLDVSDFLNWLRKRDFDIELVKGVLNK